MKVLATSLVVGVLLATATASEPTRSGMQTTAARGYFGEVISSATEKQQLVFERGLQLFSKVWNGQLPSNAQSCITCHSQPMPGGSGASESTLVVPRDLLSQLPHSSRLIRPPPLFGLGLLLNVDRAAGSSGRLGAFGTTDSLRDFVNTAFEVELGVVTPRRCAAGAVECVPQINNSDLDAVVSYLNLLAPPPLGADRAEEVDIFGELGCAGCHTPVVTARLAGELHSIRPYSDQQVHSVGGMHPVVTPPLWGLGSVGPPYWHDGSVRTIADAIVRHEGEAVASASAYKRLSEGEKELLLNFLNDL